MCGAVGLGNAAVAPPCWNVFQRSCCSAIVRCPSVTRNETPAAFAALSTAYHWALTRSSASQRRYLTAILHHLSLLRDRRVRSTAAQRERRRYSAGAVSVERRSSALPVERSGRLELDLLVPLERLELRRGAALGDGVRERG